MTDFLCTFEPLDTWFFRESRPQGSVGSSELGSVFPPPVRTLLGAVRTAIGDAHMAQHGGSWREFASNEALRALIGFGDDLGPLRVQGPWLRFQGKRLLPAPANLMVKKDKNGNEVYFLLAVGEPVRCDLGKVRLPKFPKKVPGLGDDMSGASPADEVWLTEAAWRDVLSGKQPAAKDVVKTHTLFKKESRLGIGRDNQRGSVKEGLLYQTQHLRLADGLQVEMLLQGLPEVASALNLPAHQLVRLGGEGRQAWMGLEPAGTLQQPAAGRAFKNAEQATAVLYTLTSSPCAPGLPAGIPEGFRAVELDDGSRVWDGEMLGKRLRVFSVACARVQREGGWDLARHQARAVSSLLPAGSALYVSALDEGLESLHAQLHGSQTTLGRGQYLLGSLPA